MITGWTLYAPCMSSSPYLLPPALEIQCLDVLESYLSHEHTTCSDMFDKQMMHRWLLDKTCPRATFKSVFVRDREGGLESRYCFIMLSFSGPSGKYVEAQM